ncbi:MAG: hypothetical protein AAF845_12025 [Bacteroidota bacterium]
MLGLLALATGTAASGQDAALYVEAAGAEAVFVNNVRVGAPGTWLTVVPGELTVRAVDDAEAWDPRIAEATVVLAAGDSTRLPLDLPRRLRIETLPIRAEVARVRADGTEEPLGTAPLTVDLPEAERLDLVARLEGYDAARRTVEADADAPVVLLLRPHPETDTEVALLPTERSTRGRTLADVGIGAAALAAGALAVHLKFRADAADDRYRSESSPEFGDEALRQEALRLDRLSAIALGGMQVGVGVLAVRFVLR